MVIVFFCWFVIFLYTGIRAEGSDTVIGSQLMTQLRGSGPITVRKTLKPVRISKVLAKAETENSSWGVFFSQLCTKQESVCSKLFFFVSADHSFKLKELLEMLDVEDGSKKLFS